LLEGFEFEKRLIIKIVEAKKHVQNGNHKFTKANKLGNKLNADVVELIQDDQHFHWTMMQIFTLNWMLTYITIEFVKN
jgi:uncharacterized coiled-coil DUF342 family protein